MNSLKLITFFVIGCLTKREYPSKPIHPSYYEPNVPTLHLREDGNDKPNINNWSTIVPYWPHYPSRTVQVLDGQWSFGWGGDNWNLNQTINPSEFNSLTPNTTNVPSAFDVKLPGVAGPQGTAFYRTTFQSKIGKDIMIYFSACAWYCQLYFDGVYIGDHRAGGYQPFWYYINMSSSSYNINQTEHQLFVVVNSGYKNSEYYSPIYITSDFWFYAGIIRQVIIHTLNSPNPSNNSLLRIDSHTNNTFDGTLNVNITFLSQFDSNNLIIHFIFIFDGNKNNQIYLNQTAIKGQQWIKFYAISVPNFKLWSISDPNLHLLEIQYIDSNKNILDSIEIRFGLRTLGIDHSNNNRLTINGNIIKPHGFSRLSDWPDTGNALTLSQIQQDFAIVKEIGATYVLGAQYGHDQRWLDLCDSGGIVVWSEILGPGINYTYLNNPYFMKYQIQQINEMLDASINNPSIIIWGLWNEGKTTDTEAIAGYNTSANAFKSRDPFRYVTWASNKETEDVVIGPVADIVSYNDYPAWYNHYGNLSYPQYHWNQMALYSQQHFPNKPFFISEYGAGAIYEYNNITDCKWSQLYQNEVLTSDTSVAINNSYISGFTIWILSDFKSPDHIECNECDYYSNSNPPVCSYINASCGRPGGLNHKGVVDYWRRYKSSFTLIQDFFYNMTD